MYACSCTITYFLALICIQIVANELHRVAEQWKDKDNPIVVAVKKIAKLLMEMAKFTRYYDVLLVILFLLYNSYFLHQSQKICNL